MRSHIGLLPQCLFIVRSRAKVNRLEERYVGRAAQRPLWVGSGHIPHLHTMSNNEYLELIGLTLHTSVNP
jgi:hypothetical protein